MAYLTFLKKGTRKFANYSYPYRVTTYARQMIIRGSNITERSLVTRCRLQSTVRSDNNPQGFLAEHFEILENRDLRTVER